MPKKKKTTAEDFNELANLILDLSDLVAQCNVPDCVNERIVDVLNKTSQTYRSYVDELGDCDRKITEQQRVNSELSGYIDILIAENEDLQQFIEVAKKFPGFQC